MSLNRSLSSNSFFTAYKEQQQLKKPTLSSKVSVQLTIGSNQYDDDIVKEHLPKKYFDLIQKIGNGGIYQRNIFILFAMNWFIAGSLTLGISFMFLNVQYECQSKGLLTNNCRDSVCSMQQAYWGNFIGQKLIESIATQYGPFLCTQQNTLALFQSLIFVGSFVGYLFSLFFTDNYGRKVSGVVSWGITSIGLIIVSTSVNLQMAMVGVLLAGAGADLSIRVSMTVFGQIVQNVKRQKYSIALNIFYGFAGVFVGVIYYLIGNWRIITMFFTTIPALITMFFIVTYFQQTPKFLIKSGKYKALKALNKIAKINGINTKQRVTIDDIKNVKQYQVDKKQFKKKFMMPNIVFKYKSLRSTTVLMCCSFFLINYLYLGPILAISKLSISPFLSQILLSLSELIAYPISLKFIQKMPRRKSGIVCFGISALLYSILVFIPQPQECNFCYQGLIQLAFMFISRFTTCFYYSILFLYITQLYPQTARGIGMGVASLFGAISLILQPSILSFLSSFNIKFSLFFTFVAILSIACLMFLKQTLNQPLQTQIKQILCKKQDYKIKRMEKRKASKSNISKSSIDSNQNSPYLKKKSSNKSQPF